MKIYIDSDYKCHDTNPDGTYREIEADFFNDKCATFIDGYCYDDSKGYARIYPWKPHAELDAAQRQYELAQLADYKAACERMGIVV